MVGTDLVKASPILDYTSAGVVDIGLAVEDIPTERAKWEADGSKASQSVVDAYRAIEEGRQLVDLRTVLLRGRGTDFLPRLALAPANAKGVSARAWHDGRLIYKAKRWSYEFESKHMWPRSTTIWRQGYTVAPVIPPDVRPAVRKGHLLLWEPDQWTRTRTHIERPPIDPALLEQVAGTLYVVVAAWELTALEAAALG